MVNVQANRIARIDQLEKPVGMISDSAFGFQSQDSRSVSNSQNNGQTVATCVIMSFNEFIFQSVCSSFFLYKKIFRKKWVIRTKIKEIRETKKFSKCQSKCQSILANPGNKIQNSITIFIAIFRCCQYTGIFSTKHFKIREKEHDLKKSNFKFKVFAISFITIFPKQFTTTSQNCFT